MRSVQRVLSARWPVRRPIEHPCTNPPFRVGATRAAQALALHRSVFRARTSGAGGRALHDHANHAPLDWFGWIVDAGADPAVREPPPEESAVRAQSALADATPAILLIFDLIAEPH
jgi:hypothetical protein